MCRFIKFLVKFIVFVLYLYVQLNEVSQKYLKLVNVVKPFLHGYNSKSLNMIAKKFGLCLSNFLFTQKKKEKKNHVDVKQTVDVQWRGFGHKVYFNQKT